MKAKLKEIYSLDIDRPLDVFYPADGSCFGLNIRMMIGPDDDNSSESFDVFVCTPDWIKKYYAQERIMIGHHKIIVLEYDFDLIKKTIERQISRCSGDDWDTIAKKLCRLGAWEFENYQA